MKSINKQSPTYILALRGKTADELRNLLRQFGDSNVDTSMLDQEAMLSILSAQAMSNQSLRKELKKSEINLKPSFYLLLMRPKSPRFPSPSEITPKILTQIAKMNSQFIRGTAKPILRNFSLESLSHKKNSLVEIELTWHRAYWYWEAPTLARSCVYEMQFGFVFMDYRSKKAIISCHSIHERDYITKILEYSYPVSLSPLVLTRPVLDQIGTFEQLKRGGYFRSKKDLNFPSNITYADEDLAIKAEARKLEDDLDVQRKQSFYQISIGSIVEQGVGATSDSGKLWIPREIPVTTIRDYSFKLLGKVANTLDQMSRKGQTDKILETLGIPRLPRIASIRDKDVKNEVCELFAQLVNMIVSKQTERPFLVRDVLPLKAIPQFFMYPRLELTDPETEEKAFWSNTINKSQFVELVKDREALTVRGYPFGEKIDLNRLRHPITTGIVSIPDVLPFLELIPTKNLLETLTEAIRHVSAHIPELDNVICLPFQINSGVLRFDLKRALGKTGSTTIGDQIEPGEVKSFQKMLKLRINQKIDKDLSKTLSKLGEKCHHMTDNNCAACVHQNRFLCLRSLVGHYLMEPTILGHKGIELSDLQGKIAINGEVARVYGFSKLNSGKSGLTLRNKNGAILFAQIAAQLDKSDFTVVSIITPSIINEDLVERLRTYCGLFRKKLLLIDTAVLSRMFLDYREQLAFDKIDIANILKVSWK